MRTRNDLGQFCFHRETNLPSLPWPHTLPPRHPWDLVKTPLLMQSVGVGPAGPQVYKLPGRAYAASPGTALWEVRAWQAEGTNKGLWGAQRVHFTSLTEPSQWFDWEAILSCSVVLGKLCGRKQLSVLNLIDIGVNLRELGVYLVRNGEALRVYFSTGQLLPWLPG